MNHDRTLIRAKDVGLLLAILTLGGMVWKMYEKPAVWDQAVKDITEVKPRVKLVEEQLIEYRASNSAQMSLIIRELDGIHREMKRR